MIPIRSDDNFCNKENLIIYVKNQGTLQSPSTTTTVYFGSGEIIQRATPPLQPYETRSLDPIIIPQECYMPSRCSFEIKVDSSNQVNEKDEANNTISDFCEKQEPQESVMLVSPPNNSREGLIVTFSWKISNSKESATYVSEVITDKGENPFDGGYEDLFNAGQKEELRVKLDASRYNDAWFYWGVRVRRGNSVFHSDIWRLHTKN